MKILKRSKVKALFNDNGKQITPQALDVLDTLVHKQIINIVRRSKLTDRPNTLHKSRITDDDIILLFGEQEDPSSVI